MVIVAGWPNRPTGRPLRGKAIADIDTRVGVRVIPVIGGLLNRLALSRSAHLTSAYALATWPQKPLALG